MTRVFGLILLIVLNVGSPFLFGADFSPDGGEPASPAGSSAIQITNRLYRSTIQGIVTWVDRNRNLVVLQDDSEATAIRVDLTQVDFSPGDRVMLEGQISPLTAAFPDYPDNPTGQGICPMFEGPTNFGENYLTRMRGFLRPPVTGKYTFWIASDDSSELLLSPDASPDLAREIASVGNGRWTDPRQWNHFPSQKSQEVLLQAGKAYYIEAVSQQGWGRDCLAVGWEGPGISQAVIDGRYLSPWIRANGNLSNANVYTATNAILREYWLNFYSGDLSVLNVPEKSILNLRRARLVERTKAELPEPMPVEAGQILKPEQNFCRVEVEGRLVFFVRKHGQAEFELAEGQRHICVHVLGDLAAPPENSLVRVRGVCEALRDSNNELVIGNIWVNDPKDVTWLDIEENWSQFKPVAMHLLAPSNPDLPAGRLIQARGRVISQESPGLWSIQGDDVFQGYISDDGTTWNSIGPPVEFAMNDPALAGFAIASHQTNGLARVKLDHVAGLSKTLQDADIGNPPIAGSFNFNQGTFTVRGSGNDIWGTSDQCHFAYQTMTGDGEVVVHVASLESADPQAKAGVMMRGSLDSQSPWAAVVLAPSDRVGLQSRHEFGKNSAGTLLGRPVGWLKLTRHRQNLFIQVDSAEKLQPGQMLDVMGALSWKNERPVLTAVHFRRVTGAIRVDTNTPVSGAQASAGDLQNVLIGNVTAESEKAQLAGHGDRFRIRGVVTFNAQLAGEPLCFVQDPSGACLVRLRTRIPKESVPVGHLVELTGGSVALTNSIPEVFPNGIADFGVGLLPKPLQYPFEEPNPDGKQFGQWTEVTGVGRSIGKNGILSVMTRDGLLSVWAGSVMADRLTNYMNALLRIRGVYWRTPAPVLLLPSEDFIEVVEPPPEDAFEIPTFSTALLGGFNVVPQSAHRMKIAGVVTCLRGNYFFVQDETGGIRVESRIPTEIMVGDAVEAVGFPSKQTFGLVMTEALVRKTGSGKSTPPAELSFDDVAGDRNNRLVTVDATLLEKHLWRGMEVLELQSGQRAFRAVLPMVAGELTALANGSQIRLTGVGQVESSPDETVGGDRPITASLELLLRSPKDVVVLQRPPWWNWKYTATLIGVFVMGLAGSLIWIRTLHRRVERRTQELRETMAKLQKETQISATLAERDRLAGEIHDSLEQGLSAIMMQMEAATKLVHRPEEVEQYLIMARNMASFSRTEVQHAVWDLQSPMLENVDLGTALHRVAREISAGNTPQVTVKISGEVRQMASSIEHHLLRIGQEAITNAVKHGKPKNISLNLDYEAKDLTLKVCDDGCGFDPQAVVASGGHFGLQGLRVRARKINASLTISSKPNEGTSIRVVVPLGNPVPQPPS